jgi:hypothetical protein
MRRYGVGELLLIACLLALLPTIPGAGEAVSETARGVVYEDLDGNGTRDEDEPGIPDVRVSNGRDIVLTDEEGGYEIDVDDDSIIFVIKPRTWRSPIDELQIPRFYYVHRPDGAPDLDFDGVSPTGALPESVDFPLYRQREPDDFHIVLFGDTQPRDQKEIDYLAHDVVEGLIGTEASFGVTLGDILFDDLSLFDSLNSTIAQVGIPWRYVLGNHDLNFDAEGDRESTATFESVYGPPYYSFDFGHVHFIVLDDVVWKGKVEDPDAYAGGNYVGGLGEDQLEFIRRDLELIDDRKMVVLFMHIPLTAEWIEEDRAGLFRMMEERPHCLSVSAHYHIHEHVFLTEEHGWMGEKPHHHLINVTTCGSWWSGAPDEEGIPHTTMRDGAPNGYSILSFEGVAYLYDFIPARRPAWEQMHIWTPEPIVRGEADTTEFLVNVYNGSERSRIDYRVTGLTDWAPMEKVLRPDPYYVEMKAQEESETPPPGRRLPRVTDSSHLWRALLPGDLEAGQYVLEVRDIDMWGIPRSGRRVIRVE